MHSIEINGRTLQYELEGSSIVPYTVFYEGTTTVLKKTWFSKKEITRPKPLFMIFENCNSLLHSKEWWKEQIEYELRKLDRMQKRSEELKKGELI